MQKVKREAVKYESWGIYRSSVALAFVIVGIWYLHWRIPTMAPASPIFSAIVYGAEIYGFIAALLHLMMTWRLTIREPLPCPEGVTVDVFVSTFNEPVDLVRKTLLAAKHMDYPHETWLIDDGNRHKMKALADRLGVRYLARLDNANAKAGNLNNAMIHSKGDFIALFDADHAPQKNFLTQTLGYFKDTSVAFVQTPHDFFNLDSYQHRLQEKNKQLWTEQALFFKVIQRGKDYWNAAFFCGSCAVIRRSSLDRIGGFATETVTEDLHTSIKLHKAGFKSIYHAESLAYGIAPANVAPFLKQRVRWGQGAMQVFKKEKLIFETRLTLAQKLNYLASMMTYFDGWQKGIFYISPAVVLLAGIMPINVEAVDFLIHFVPYYALSFIAFEEVGRGYGGTLYIEQYNFARFAAFAWSTLGLFFGKIRFNVTSKVRDRSSNATQMFLPQLSILLLNTGAIPFGLILSMETHYLPQDAVYFNILWAAVNCALALLLLNFTRKTQIFLREEYRFPIPLPVIIREGNSRVHGTIDNIAMSGCRVYAPLPYTVRKNRLLRGEIYLPSGPLPFEAQIMSEITGQVEDQTFIKAVGCRFIWNQIETRDALELFLYGTDLQWKLLNLNESSATPLQWLTRISRFFNTQPDERWATCTLLQDDGGNNRSQPLRLGMIPLTSDGAVPRQLVTFQPLSTDMDVRGLIFTRMGRIGMRAQISEGECLENSAGPIYLYPISECIIQPEVKDLSVIIPHENMSSVVPSLLAA
ncbi:MAG: glycosyltransferase [Nitrosomonadales bacterium]|nr:glycosyltransferase [Nitrosomonadales bacterium]